MIDPVEALSKRVIEESLDDELFDRQRFYEYLKIHTSTDEFLQLREEPFALVLELYRQDFLGYLGMYSAIYYASRVTSERNTSGNGYSLSDFEKELRRSFILGPLRLKLNRFVSITRGLVGSKRGRPS